MLFSLLWGVVTAQDSEHITILDSTDRVNVGYDIMKFRQHTSNDIEVVNVDELHSAETDIVKALYTKFAGLNVTQGQGRSSDNYAQISVHGHSPLVLVDGFPRDLKELTLSEIESVTLLKDAAALAIYGVRGANGVMNITTKRGKQGDFRMTASYQFGLKTQFRAPEFADAHVYANKFNEALKLDGLSGGEYSKDEIKMFESQLYPYAYPNVDWWDEVYNKVSTNHQLNLTFTGGNDKFKHFTTASYSWDKDMFDDSNDDSRYSVKPFDVRLNLRTNLDVKITPTTSMKLGLMGRMQEVNSSISVDNIYSAVYRTPSAVFPVKSEGGIYGGNNIYGNANPVALLLKSGHHKAIYTTLFADLRLTQDLSSWVKGLSADIAISFDNQGDIWEQSAQSYEYIDLRPEIILDGAVTLDPIIYDKNQSVLSHGRGLVGLYARSNFQTKVAYDRVFERHTVNGALIYDQQSDINNGRNRTFGRQSMMIALGYDYDKRYFVDAVYSYSGTNVLPESSRFNSYPAISAAWLVSNEDLFKSNIVDLLKITASYGVSGWDGNNDHELHLQSYGWASDYMFNGVFSSGFGEGTLPVVDLTVEKSKRATVGIDAALLSRRLTISASYFNEERSNILVDAGDRISGIIGIPVAQENAGINKYQGVDISLGWRDVAGDFSYGVSGIFNFTRSKIVNNNEAFQEYDYLYKEGNSLNQMYGLEVVGFFNDQVDINNSPVHSFMQVKPGDIKYRDQNGDNIIDNQDVVKMFKTSVPEIYYGINLDVAWKRWALAAEFQGAANRTVSLLSSPLYAPLVNNGNISQTFLDREVTWNGENASSATMPRLTTLANDNNYRNNSLWYRDGSFFKLRHLQLSYDVIEQKGSNWGMQVYARGTDLFSIDGIKFADPEQLHATYPSQSSYWFGIKLNF